MNENKLLFDYDDYTRITYRRNHDPHETVGVYYNGEHKGLQVIEFDSEDRELIEINDGYFYLDTLIEE